MSIFRIGPWIGAIVSVGIGGLAGSSASPQSQVRDPAMVVYPEGFRGWTHVKSAIVWPDTPSTSTFSGLHNIYANESAMAGYRTGIFPDEAMIVFDLFDLEEVDGGLQPGRRKSVDVMVRDASVHGGWRFERFYGGNPTERADARLRSQCLACHLREPQGDGVFSAFVG